MAMKGLAGERRKTRKNLRRRRAQLWIGSALFIRQNRRARLINRPIL